MRVKFPNRAAGHGEPPRGKESDSARGGFVAKAKARGAWDAAAIPGAFLFPPGRYRALALFFFRMAAPSAPFFTRCREQVLWAARHWREVLKELRNKLLTGIVFAIPLIVTCWVLRIAYGTISGISAPFLKGLGIDVSIVSFFVTIAMLVALGFLASNVFGQRMLESFERALLRVPVVATIYAGVKQVIDSFKSFKDVSNFKRVAYVEYPSPGCKLIGFVTGQFFDESLGMEMTSVVIPTAPNPMTGLVLVVEASRVSESALSIEEAMKLIVSAGLVVPKRRGDTPPSPPPREPEALPAGAQAFASPISER